MPFSVRRFLGVGCSISLLAGLAWLAVATPARAKDAFVFISGGGTPLSNNYSQYVQAKAVSTWLYQRYPADEVWTFFGAGNRPGRPAALADVHREVQDDGLWVDTWLPGDLPHNRPATREAILQALRTEVLPTVAGGGTLYLIVGDHGELTRDKPEESAITLWQMKRDPRTRWNTDSQEILTVTELRQTLAAGLGQGRVVFAMTQCHAGGFHFLGLPRELAVNPAWLRQPPEKAAEPAPVDLRIAGFTAVDEASLAAGCMPNPDPDQWAGYERFFPEQLLGTDLLSGHRQGPGSPSFEAAHDAAVLIDFTIDKPRSTSEQLLAQWAQLIVKQLPSAEKLTDEARAARHDFLQVMNGGGVRSDYADLLAKQALFQRRIETLARQFPDLAEVLRHGTMQALLDEKKSLSGGPHRNGADDEARRLWRDVVRPAWRKAVMARRVPEVPAAALPFERHLLRLGDHGRDLMFDEHDGLLNAIYWQSSLAEPATTDPAKARAVTRWAAMREDTIIAWAEASPDAKVRAAGEAWDQAEQNQPDGWDQRAGRADRLAAVDRVFFYRQVLGAWTFLLAVHDQPALDQLQALRRLEATPLPPPRS